VTGATVGYGDIRLAPDPGCTLTRWLIMVEPMVFLLVTALLIPRAVARIVTPPRIPNGQGE
jgi:hypothetical protein